MSKLPTVADRIEEEAANFLVRTNKRPQRVVLGELMFEALLEEIWLPIRGTRPAVTTYMSSCGQLDVLISLDQSPLVQVS